MKRSLTLLALAVALTSPAFAAQDGLQGSDSTGSFDITLTVADEQSDALIQIVGFQDLEFDTTPGITPNNNGFLVCVISPTALTYDATISATPLLFGTAQSPVPYELEFGEQGGSDNLLVSVSDTQATASRDDLTAISTGDCNVGSTGLIGVGVAITGAPTETGTGTATVTITVTPD